MLNEIMVNNFRRDWNSLVEIQPLLWANFVPTLMKDGDPNKRISNVYCELTDREILRKVCYEKLDEYNNFYVASRMNLVLFDVAI